MTTYQGKCKYCGITTVKNDAKFFQSKKRIEKYKTKLVQGPFNIIGLKVERDKPIEIKTWKCEVCGNLQD